jgi:hypothetical protein
MRRFRSPPQPNILNCEEHGKSSGIYGIESRLIRRQGNLEIRAEENSGFCRYAYVNYLRILAF